MKNFIPLVLVLGVAAAGGIIFRTFVLEKIDSEPNIINVDGRMVQIFQSQRCELKSVISGDTIICQDGTNVKLCGIKAKENPQATAKLQELLKGREIMLSPMSKNPMIAEVYAKVSSNEELFINAEMVRAGLAISDSSQIDSCLGKPQIIDAEKGGLF